MKPQSASRASASRGSMAAGLSCMVAPSCAWRTAVTSAGRRPCGRPFGPLRPRSGSAASGPVPSSADGQWFEVLSTTFQTQLPRWPGRVRLVLHAQVPVAVLVVARPAGLPLGREEDLGRDTDLDRQRPERLHVHQVELVVAALTRRPRRRRGRQRQHHERRAEHGGGSHPRRGTRQLERLGRDATVGHHWIPPRRPARPWWRGRSGARACRGWSAAWCPASTSAVGIAVPVRTGTPFAVTSLRWRGSACGARTAGAGCRTAPGAAGRAPRWPR